MARLAAAALALLIGTGVASAAEQIEANLEVVGRWEAGVPATYGDVTVVGSTAIVATQTRTPCPTASATVLDLNKPGRPRAVATIAIPPGMTVADLDATNVGTAAFTGDLVAIALVPMPGSCHDASGGMVIFHDVTEPARPRSLAKSTGSRSVSLAQRPDGRVLAASVSPDRPGVKFDDVSDPARPVTVGQWTDAQPPEAASCGDVTVSLRDEGEAALVTFADGRVYDLDLTEPGMPAASEAATTGHAGHAAVLPLGNRTIAIVSEEPGGCAGDAGENGLRVLTLERKVTPREEGPVRFPGAAAPGRLVASGTLAYVAWHGDGLRVVDFAEVRARTVAQFAPTEPDIVGVALLAQHIVVTDGASGLYVLDRPEEAGGRAGFWSQFLSLLPYLGFAGVMAAVFVVPRLAMGRAPVGARSRVPSPVGRRRA